MKLQMESGSEGPAHDPYAYTEYTILYRDGRIVTLHLGLDEWLRVNDEEVAGFRAGPDAQASFEAMTQLTVRRFEKSYERINGPYSRCPDCGSSQLSWFSGYVGEEMQHCDSCRRIIWCERVTEAMIR
jgi:hypothetical protein